MAAVPTKICSIVHRNISLKPFQRSNTHIMHHLMILSLCSLRKINIKIALIVKGRTLAKAKRKQGSTFCVSEFPIEGGRGTVLWRSSPLPCEVFRLLLVPPSWTWPPPPQGNFIVQLGSSFRSKSKVWTKAEL